MKLENIPINGIVVITMYNSENKDDSKVYRPHQVTEKIENVLKKVENTMSKTDKLYFDEARFSRMFSKKIPGSFGITAIIHYVCLNPKRMYFLVKEFCKETGLPHSLYIGEVICDD